MISTFPVRPGVRPVVAALPALLGCLVALVVAPSTARAEGMFVAECAYSHTAKNDPIVFPKLPGRSHLHEFFGNASTDARSTAASLRRSTAECNPGGDESAYWVPALYRDGKRVKPKHAQVYYQDFGRYGQVQPFPTGLRMVAGDVTAKKPQPNWVVHWECANDHAGGFATIPTCTKEQGPVTLRISFPDCWDGKRLDSPDHKSHMAYNRKGGFEPGLQRCPKSHPVVVPQLQINVFWPIQDGKGVRIASGSTDSAHGDFFNAWNPKVLKRKVDVLNSGQACHPYFGCAGLASNDGEPVTATARKHLVDRFYPPRGSKAGKQHHGRH